MSVMSRMSLQAAPWIMLKNLSKASTVCRTVNGSGAPLLFLGRQSVCWKLEGRA